MALSIEINGIAYRCANTYSISQTAGAVSQSQIDIEVATGQDVPLTLSSCTIYDDIIPVFLGIVSNVSSPEYNGGKEARRYRISLQSKESVFNNRLVSEAYENKYIHEIVQSLYDNYIAAEGVNLGTISTTEQVYDNYNCQYTKLSDVLQELADAISATYYIDADNYFHFVTRDEFVQIPAPEHITGLQLEEDTGELRTVQIVTGASEETSQQIENTYWPADQSAMTLGYQVSSITGITINAVTAAFGQLGVDDDNTSITFLYTLGSNTLTVNPNATTKPAAEQNVVVVYNGYYEIVVINTNDALKESISMLNGTSGMIENVLTDETITSFGDADTKALSLLDQYDERDQVVSCISHDIVATALYNMWYINRPDLNIVGNYVITERELSPFGTEMIISVKLKNKGYFARYGTTLNKGKKNKGSTVKIYKTTVMGDKVTNTETLTAEALDLVYCPTSGAYADPMFLDSFYPGV